MYGQEAFNYLAKHSGEFESVLDVGSGSGDGAKAFEGIGKLAVTADINDSANLYLDFNKRVIFTANYDLVWCCHALEHALNSHIWIQNLIRCCEPKGIIAVTVPPAKREIVGGHVSLWNAGLLLYRLILAGLDCRDAIVMQYRYNISVIVRNVGFDMPKLAYDNGDIEKLAEFFPCKAYQGFDGRMLTETNMEPNK